MGTTRAENGHAGEVLARHRREHLAATLRVAGEKSPFYRQLLGGRRITADTAADVLAGLPVLDPATWESCRGDLRTGIPEDVVVGFTSGYTGEPRAYLSTEPERLAFLRAAGPSLGGERVLNLVGLNHGLDSAQTYSAGVVTVPLVAAGHFAHAAHMLERRREPYRDMPPFDTVAGSLRLVKHLTLYLLRRNASLAGLGVQRLHVYRHMLSPRWRDRLRHWWGAEVTTSYGVSEVSACNCLLCGDCHHHHPAPSGLVEYLDPGDLRTAVRPGGRGTLVITAFHPFVQLEPRIRYRPGDLVEVAAAPCPTWNEHGFRPLGRERHAMRTPTGGWFTAAPLATVAVAEGSPFLPAAGEAVRAGAAASEAVEAGAAVAADLAALWTQGFKH